jgi:PRC-barrel domain
MWPGREATVASQEHFEVMGVKQPGWVGELGDALRDMTVLDASGNAVGHVVDVYGETSDDVRYVTVSLANGGGRRVAVPVDDTDVVDHQLSRALRLPYEREHLLEGPLLADPTHFSLAHEGAVHAHFTGRSLDEIVDERQTTPAATPEIARADAAASTPEAARADIHTRQSAPAPTPEIAAADVADPPRARGIDPATVRMRRRSLH